MARASGTEPTLDLRRLIEMVGVKQVIQQIGPKRVLDAIDWSAVAAQLTPEKRAELIRRLQG